MKKIICVTTLFLALIAIGCDDSTPSCREICDVNYTNCTTMGGGSDCTTIRTVCYNNCSLTK